MHRRVYASMWIFGDAIGLRIDSIKASLMRTLLFLSRIYRIWLVSRVCDDRLICQQANQTRASVFSRREKACIPLEPQIRSRRACTGTELKRGGGGGEGCIVSGARRRLGGRAGNDESRARICVATPPCVCKLLVSQLMLT